MAKDIDVLLAELRNSPTNAAFSDACKVASHWFGVPRQKGTSHCVWKMPWAGNPRVNLQRGEGGKAKAYQVRQLVQAIDRLLEERKK